MNDILSVLILSCTSQLFILACPHGHINHLYETLLPKVPISLQLANIIHETLTAETLLCTVTMLQKSVAAKQTVNQ